MKPKKNRFSVMKDVGEKDICVMRKNDVIALDHIIQYHTDPEFFDRRPSEQLRTLRKTINEMTYAGHIDPESKDRLKKEYIDVIVGSFETNDYYKKMLPTGQFEEMTATINSMIDAKEIEPDDWKKYRRQGTESIIKDLEEEGIYRKIPPSLKIGETRNLMRNIYNTGLLGYEESQEKKKTLLKKIIDPMSKSDKLIKKAILTSYTFENDADKLGKTYRRDPKKIIMAEYRGLSESIFKLTGIRHTTKHLWAHGRFNSGNRKLKDDEGVFASLRAAGRESDILIKSTYN